MKDWLLQLTVFVVMAVAVKLFDRPIRALLKRTVNSKLVKKLVLKHYVKKADRLFPGPKRGQMKHTYVTQQAERWRIKADGTVDEMITCIVSFLNQKSGAVKTQLQNKADAAVDETINNLSGGK